MWMDEKDRHREQDGLFKGQSIGLWDKNGTMIKCGDKCIYPWHITGAAFGGGLEGQYGTPTNCTPEGEIRTHKNFVVEVVYQDGSFFFHNEFFHKEVYPNHGNVEIIGEEEGIFTYGTILHPPAGI